VNLAENAAGMMKKATDFAIHAVDFP